MDFINSIIHNSGTFISGRTIVPGPAHTPQISRGPFIHPSVANTSGNVNKLAPARNSTRVMDDSDGLQSESILRMSVTQMNSWGPATQENQSIPKAYKDLDKNDCAKVVAESIRNIIVYTTNDDFRAKCFSKLGVSSSAEAETVIRSKLDALIAQQEEQEMLQQNQNETDDEAMMCEELEQVES